MLKRFHLNGNTIARISSTDSKGRTTHTQDIETWKYSVGLTRFNLNHYTHCLMVENEPWNALLCQKWSHWPFSHKRQIIRLRRIIHLQNPSKLTEKQMDEVRRIVHPKLRPFHFQIKTYYLSDVNYTTDNPSLVWIRPLWAFWSSSMTGYKNDLMESKKSTGTTRKADLNLVRNLLSLSWPSSFLASLHGVFVSATFLTGARVAWQLVSAWPSVHEVPSSIPGDIAALFQLLSFLCSFDYNVALDTLKRGKV